MMLSLLLIYLVFGMITVLGMALFLRTNKERSKLAGFVLLSLPLWPLYQTIVLFYLIRRALFQWGKP